MQYAADLTQLIGHTPLVRINKLNAGPAELYAKLEMFNPYSVKDRPALAMLQAAEKSRMEAELKNLRNQLNPHFLLNTLNNIYALIAFDTDKAQEAVQELSRLLRHVLYDNQQNFVPLNKEMDFIRNYIGLMRIRLSDQVKVETTFDVHPDSRTPIAPLIFISLIENAFKHGISPTEPSYISIRFAEDEHTISCEIENTNHPKTQADKSGALTYPGHYRWQQGPNAEGTLYRSTLIIDKTPTP